MNENTTQPTFLDTRWQKPLRYLSENTSPIHFSEATGNELILYTGMVSDPPQTEQYTNMDDQPLYWLNGEIGGIMTTDVNEAFDLEDISETPVPVMAYSYNILQTAKFTFEEITRDWGSACMPVIELGGGDPAGNKKARIYKDDTAFRIEYDRAPEDEEEEGETYFFEIGDEGIKTYPELTNSHLILNRQPVPADAEGLAENGVVLVYNPSQPLV